MMVRSVLGRKREYRIQFNKEKNGCWYVDFPHWPFSHDNLAMVSGADKMLELLSNGNLFAKMSVIPANEQEEHKGYIELEQTEHSLFGGSTYQVKYEPFIKRYKQDTLWICPVTLFVLGHYPKFIYIKSYTFVIGINHEHVWEKMTKKAFRSSFTPITTRTVISD